MEHWDAVSVHPYRQSGPETAIAEYERLRRLIARYAPKGKNVPILAAEWGYSAAWRNFDADQQGRMLARQWLVNVSQGVPLSIWYDWHDDGPDPQEAERHFGTVAFSYHRGRDPVYDPKPAYQAARTLTSALKGSVFVKRIDVGHPDDYVLLFENDGRPRLAIWTVAGEPRAIRVPLERGEFEAVAHTGEQLLAVAAKDGFLPITATAAPQYLIAR